MMQSDFSLHYTKMSSDTLPIIYLYCWSYIGSKCGGTVCGEVLYGQVPGYKTCLSLPHAECLREPSCSYHELDNVKFSLRRL